MKPRHRHLSAALLLLGLIGTRGAAAAPIRPSGRVILDRLTFSPDGGWLAVEARYRSQKEEAVDTLLIDLSSGVAVPRNPRPEHLALTTEGGLAVATRYALMTGRRDSPESLRVTASLDPTRDRVERMAFSPGNDSLVVISRDPTGAWYDILAFRITDGRRGLLDRVGTWSLAESLWVRRVGEAPVIPIEPTPFPVLYQPMGRDLYFLDRSEAAIPGTSGQWIYDLHHREVDSGRETVVTRYIAPFAAIVSPDSGWMAVAGARARPDYGGELLPSLWMASADGATFYTVLPEGMRDGPVSPTGMGWSGGGLWFTSSGALYRVDPDSGRAVCQPIGAPPPAWSDSLKPAAVVWTFRLPDAYADSIPATSIRDRLIHEGRPAWVAVQPNDQFAVTIGAEPDQKSLQDLADRLGLSGLRGLEDHLEASRAGYPYVYGTVSSPDGLREAGLLNVGPPGGRASELWLTERRGERRIRLLGPMITPAR